MLRHQSHTAPLAGRSPHPGDPAWLARFPDWSWDSARAALHFLEHEPALRQQAALIISDRRPFGWNEQLLSTRIITVMSGPRSLITRDEANLMALRGQTTPLGQEPGEVRERFVQTALQELISALDIGNLGPCPVPLPTHDLLWTWQDTLPEPIRPAETGTEEEDLKNLMHSAMNLMNSSLNLALLTGHKRGWAVHAGQLAALSISRCPRQRLNRFAQQIPAQTGPFSATLTPDENTEPLLLMGQWSHFRLALAWTP